MREGNAITNGGMGQLSQDLQPGEICFVPPSLLLDDRLEGLRGEGAAGMDSPF